MSPEAGIGPVLKIECFCLNLEQRVVYTGTMGGALSGYSIDDLARQFEIPAHAGLIAAVAYQSNRRLIACLGGDNTVSVWKIEDGGTPSFLCRIPLWNLQPSNDERFIADFQSESQALAFHDYLPRIATRSANGALLEFDIDDFGQYRYRHCLRIFDSSDLTCVRYVPESSLLLAGSTGGQLGIISNGEVIGDVVTGGSNIHWIEPLGAGEFLLASDSRQVIRVSVYELGKALAGPKFCRDDLEHVALSNDGKSAYAASFDRKIYRVNPQTCLAQGIVFDAPFKCRWVRPVPGDAERLVVQTRDGGLHLVDVLSKSVLKSIRHTPPAIWTSDRRDADRIYLAGEPDAVFTLDLKRGTTSMVSIEHLSKGSQVYTKRLISLDGGRGCLLGRTDGIILRLKDDEIVGALHADAPVRDLSEGPDGTVFAALEDGRVLGIDLDELAVTMKFVSPIDEPIWSLAFNGQDTLAIGERGGKLRLLSARSLEQVSEHTQLVRPKRMKWQNSQRLMFGWSDQLRALNLADGSEELIVDSIGNTIEDFIVQVEYDYVAFISYMRNIYLARARTGEILCMVPDGEDYSKGLAWVTRSQLVHEDGVPEFITYGRHGSINRYKIVNEKILPAGQIPFVAMPRPSTVVRSHDRVAEL
jgi:WD40 repeat protein